MGSISGVTALTKQRRNDIWLLVGIAAVLAVFAAIYFATRTTGEWVTVIQNGDEIARYALSENREIPITNGDTVTNVLVIQDGKAFVQTATCPDQICVKHRAVSKTGETVVCLPNELVIKIEASSDGDVPDMVV